MKMKIYFAIPMSYDWRYVDWRLRKLLWEEIESITQYKQWDIRIIIVFGRSKHYAACELNKLKACRWTKEFHRDVFAFCHDEICHHWCKFLFLFYDITGERRKRCWQENKSSYCAVKEKFEFVVVTW
jgi:hypothetical protein